MRIPTGLGCIILLVGSWVLPQVVKPALAETPDDHWWDGFGFEHGFNDVVAILTVFRGELIAGGPFTASGSGLLDQIGRWDGEAWHPLGGGIDHLPCPGLFCAARVNALTVYNGDLIVGGKFWTVDDRRVPAKCVARWDGSAWHPIGEGIDEFTDPPEAEVYGLTVYNGTLVAGGNFYSAEGRRVNHIAYWDGYAWRSLGGGTDGVVGEFATYNGDLVVVGAFNQAGGVAAKNIARWDGVAWHPLGEGSAELSTAVTVYNVDLYASGKFRAPDGSMILGIARWDESSWHSAGTNNIAMVLAEYNDDLVLGDGGDRLLRWNGSSWLPFGSGVNDVVYTVAVLGSSLFVGGKFTTAGGKPSARIARWDDVITPVTVQDLQAVATAQKVALSWHMHSWWETRGISVLRAESVPGPYRQRTESSLVPQEFMAFTDQGVLPGADYWYRLVAEYQDGETITLATLRVSIPRDLETALLIPVPIEDGRRIQLRYRIGQPATPILLQAYDVRGALLRSLDRGVREPGEYSRVWDYRTDAGIRLPRGLYIIRLQAGQAVASRKVVVTAE